MNAKQSLSSISENQDLWVAQYRQEIKERDYNSGMSAAENRGIAKGEKRAKLEAARNMLMDNMPNAVVAKYTGLPLETVKQLSENI